MIQVTIRNNEALEKALRRFKKKFEKAGILNDVKKNAHYTKSSTEKRLKRANSSKPNISNARSQGY
ncbi:MAG: 30S ribosomal protein S21 [Candidatus Marinimicrobia bacterium]|nr:30S ribosomal protein S21 [Candidatus Neomarinimicrobiota bacterium]